jgi:hypothetical protein
MNLGASRSYNHPLIVVAASATLLIVVTGIVILFYRLAKDLKRLLTKRRASRPAT